MRRVLVALVAFFLPFSYSYADQYVHSLPEFESHVRAHIRRVRALGLALLASHSGEFPQVQRELLSEFLNNHDRSKRGRILDALYKDYGHTFENLSPKEREKSFAVRAWLNLNDAKVAMRFFSGHRMLTSNGKPDAVAVQYLRIEKIADLVDRGMDPVASEEFNKGMDLASQRLQNRSDREFALELERDYAAITGETEFENLPCSATFSRRVIFSSQRIH